MTFLMTTPTNNDIKFVQDHGSITNAECRQLLGLGDPPPSQVESIPISEKMVRF